MAEKITVLNPEGTAPRTTGRSLAPRPENLDGKTVYLVDVGFENSDIFTDQLRAWFERNHPDVHTVREHLENPFDERPDVYEKIGKNGDAAIFAVGL